MYLSEYMHVGRVGFREELVWVVANFCAIPFLPVKLVDFEDLYRLGGLEGFQGQS